VWAELNVRHRDMKHNSGSGIHYLNDEHCYIIQMKQVEMGMTCSIQGQHAFYVSKSLLNFLRKISVGMRGRRILQCFLKKNKTRLC
jgi:hypothetical protein